MPRQGRRTWLEAPPPQGRCIVPDSTETPGNSLTVQSERSERQRTATPRSRGAFVLRGRADAEGYSEPAEDDIGRPRRDDRRQAVHAAEWQAAGVADPRR